MQFEHRGVVEGFYGPAWSHEDRLWVIEQIGRWGMNRYVYAPKDDPLHRSRWRETYSGGALTEFRELVERGQKVGVEVGFALSPGLSIVYSSAEDRAALIGKFRAFADLGSRFLTLSLDDVPTTLAHAADRRAFGSLAAAHVQLACEVRDAFDPGVLVWLVPTDYLGTTSTEYLQALGEGLPPEIEIGWTGRTIVPPSIESEEAAVRASTLKRRPLIWDNVPVSDGPMRSMLHLGPYDGRDANLAEHASGLLLNPMQHARASCIALRTAAEYMSEPSAYEPERAWLDALEELGQGDVGAFRLFAEAHRFSPLHPHDRDRELEARVAEISEALETGADFAPLLLEVRDLAHARLGVSDALREKLVDRRLLSELEPWLESYEQETRRISGAIDTLHEIVREGPQSEKVYSFMRLQGQLSRETRATCTSYGPRRVLYPQLTSMHEDDMALSRGMTLVRDQSLADEILVFVEDLALFLITDAD